MIYLFIAGTVLALLLSFLCSLTEAALYAVPAGYIRHQEELGRRSGKVLARFKGNMAQPISSILVVNTLAGTGGAAVAGWAAGSVFGDGIVVLFTCAFTLGILYIGEIIPKLIGVTYSRRIASFMALPLAGIVSITSPLVWIAEGISRCVKRGPDQKTLSPHEFLSMAALGTEEGVLDRFEGSVIANVVGLDRLLVKEVLTPRVRVFRKQEEILLSEVEGELTDWHYTRVPLFAADNEDNLTGYVMQRDIYRELIKGQKQRMLREIARPLKTVPEVMRVDQLLLKMFEEKEMICAVVDEYGGLAGIITLEDIIEEIVGREIVDEYDHLRAFKQILRLGKARKKPAAKT